MKTKHEMRKDAIEQLQKFITGECRYSSVVHAIEGNAFYKHSSKQDAEYLIDLLTDDEPQYEGDAFAKGPRDADGILWFRGDMSDSEWGVIEKPHFDGDKWMLRGHDLTAPWVPADSIRHAPMRTATQREDDLIELIKDAAVDYCLVAASEGRWHQLCNEFEEGYVTLPKDANDEVIHIGDELKWDDGERITVEGIGKGILFYMDSDGGLQWTAAGNKHHYHKPTIKDVLREFADEVRRCCDTEDTIAEYAERLRLKEDADGRHRATHGR